MNSKETFATDRNDILHFFTNGMPNEQCKALKAINVENKKQTQPTIPGSR